MTGAPVLLLCQIAAAMARMRWATRMATPSKVRPPWASRSSWPLRVSLTDSISWRIALSRGSPWRAASSLRAGRSSVMPRAARSASVCAAGEAFVGDQDQAGAGGGELGLDVEHRGQHLAFADLRVGQRPQDGHPGGVQIRYSRSPQNQREWLAQ